VVVVRKRRRREEAVEVQHNDCGLGVVISDSPLLLPSGRESPGL